MFGVSSLDLINCVICDDVRVELNGKETIVGVYTAGISVPFIPFSITICLWLQVIWSGEGESHIEISVLNTGNRQVGEIEGPAQVISPGYQSTLAIRGLNFNADMEGTYDIKVAPADTTIKEK